VRRPLQDGDGGRLHAGVRVPGRLLRASLRDGLRREDLST